MFFAGFVAGRVDRRKRRDFGKGGRFAYEGPNPSMLRVLTYNVHRWLGTDRRTSPERIAAVIGDCDPDVVALQEVRTSPGRGGTDQLALVARELGMHFHFHYSLRFGTQRFGNAVLTRRPSRLVKAGRLPGWPGGPPLEPRCAVWVAIETRAGELQVVATHLGLLGPERLAQARALLGPDWLGHEACRGPTVLLGDLNAAPASRAYRLLAESLTDAQQGYPDADPRPTFHTRVPVLRIDHIFVRGGVSVVSAAPVRSPLARVASDHLPLTALLAMPEGREMKESRAAVPAI
jgi:endonuclease/exonuclease/phosphatase family metal-dependent hydrolase